MHSFFCILMYIEPMRDHITAIAGHRDQLRQHPYMPKDRVLFKNNVSRFFSAGQSEWLYIIFLLFFFFWQSIGSGRIQDSGGAPYEPVMTLYAPKHCSKFKCINIICARDVLSWYYIFGTTVTTIYTCKALKVDLTSLRWSVISFCFHFFVAAILFPICLPARRMA